MIDLPRPYVQIYEEVLGEDYYRDLYKKSFGVLLTSDLHGAYDRRYIGLYMRVDYYRILRP